MMPASRLAFPDPRTASEGGRGEGREQRRDGRSTGSNLRLARWRTDGRAVHEIGRRVRLAKEAIGKLARNET